MATKNPTLSPRDLEKVETLLKGIRGMSTIMSTSDEPPEWDDIRWVAQDLSFKADNALKLLSGEKES